MIRIQNLRKSYEGTTVLNNIQLEVEEGEALVIIGGSGCGKSTLLRCINRLIEPDSGEIWIDGQNILEKNADVDAIRAKMGMVYQQFNLFSHLNVIENVILAPMRVLGMERGQALREAEALLEQVGMAEYKYNMPDTLSGGQKQRVAIARALAMRPKIMLFDEPTSALDPTMVNEVETVIYNLVQSGITAVIVTHEMRFARRVASRVAFLAEKGVYEIGTAAEVFDDPKKPLTRRFLYNNRMYERRVSADSLAPDKMREEMTALLRRYDYTSKQLNAVSVLLDELILPLAKKAGTSQTTLRLICSETGTEHVALIHFEGFGDSALAWLTPLNHKLLTAFCQSVYEVPRQNGTEVVVHL